MAEQTGQREITSVSIITDLADTDYVIVSDGIDVKKILKKDLIKELGTANKVTFTPTGTISSTDVQSAIAEVDSELKRKVYSVTVPVDSCVANSDSYSGWFPYVYSGTNADVVAIDSLEVYGKTDTDTTEIKDKYNGSWVTSDGGFKIYFTKVITKEINIYVVVKKGVTV